MRRGAQPSAKRESPHERQKRHGSLPCLFRHRVRGTPKAAYGPHLHSPAESVPYRALSPPHTAAGQCLRPAAVPFRRQRMSQQKPINSPAKPTARITTARGPARSVRQKVTVPVWLSSSRYWPSNRASVLVQPSSLSTQRSYRLPGSGRRPVPGPGPPPLRCRRCPHTPRRRPSRPPLPWCGRPVPGC